MCEDFTVRYEECEDLIPTYARRFVGESLRSELSGPSAADVADATLLIVSELTTNALRAGCGWIALELNVRREHVKIVVTDDAPGWPVQRTAGSLDVRGRGLAIVDAVAKAWGVQGAAAGKQVWAKIASPEGMVHSRPCR